MAQRGRGGTGNGPGRDRSGARRSGGGTGRGVPAQRRTPGRAGTAKRPGRSRRTGAERTRAPRPAGQFTSRMVALALVLVALILSYAYPVRTYLAQRAEIADLQQSQARQNRRIASLQEQRDKWNDPQYVAAQARDRLQMVRPGDRSYAVYDDPGAGRHPGRSGDGRVRAHGPWYAKMWSSVQGADGTAAR